MKFVALVAKLHLGILLTACLLLAAMTSCAPTGIYHTVEPGQTLYRIAKTYHIPEAELARANRIKDPTKLRTGQKLYLPGVVRPRQVPTYASNQTATAKPAEQPNRSAAAARSKPAPQVISPSPQSRAPKASPAKTARSSASAEKGVFIWPVKGKVVSQFGADGASANKGVGISSAVGGVVVAAAPGKVIYSGNGIRGYGNLIIIEHAGDFFTVYGYNKQNLVKPNDFVGQGDKIALSGQPQNGQSPRLHFEIRRGKAAVNPIFYLP